MEVWKFIIVMVIIIIIKLQSVERSRIMVGRSTSCQGILRHQKVSSLRVREV